MSIVIVAPPPAAAQFTGNPIFVDPTLGADITNGLYNHVTRSGGGGNGHNAYTTIQGAVDSMTVAGDEIYIRGGTYLENVEIKGSTVPSGTSWTDGEHCAMQSYPGEWAKIDGQNNEHYTIGKTINGRSAGADDLFYWRFERLEITGGTDGFETGGGLVCNVGPFWIRYCYIHDNYGTAEGENPAGISGYVWTDSIIEYCWFENNGLLTGDGGNASHVGLFSDFDWVSIGTNGYVPGDLDSLQRNVLKYNNFGAGVIGYKHKGAQFFTGRNRAAPATDFVETYNDQGDHIHHNFFQDLRLHGVMCEQDFCQIYHNIFDNCLEPITVDIQPDWQFHNVITWNNVAIPGTGGGKFINRYGCQKFVFDDNPDHYGNDHNNIVDQSDKVVGADWFTGVAFNLFNGCFGGSRPPHASSDFSNYTLSHNYCYRPVNADLFKLGTGTDYYTQSEFEAQTETGSPRVMYSQAYNAGDLLWESTTGNGKYKTRGAHVVDTGVTVADGGVGGAHPYLAGITFPSYLGAVNPAGNGDWVDGVIDDVGSVAWLTAQALRSTPSWVE